MYVVSYTLVQGGRQYRCFERVCRMLCSSRLDISVYFLRYHCCISRKIRPVNARLLLQQTRLLRYLPRQHGNHFYQYMLCHPGRPHRAAFPAFATTAGRVSQHPNNLLIFAAGNSGSTVRDSCTITSPSLAKNVLAVGASTSGGTRITWTGEDGNVTDGTNRATGIDTVSFFSSRGFSLEGRIKPEIVAPGDLVRTFDFVELSSVCAKTMYLSNLRRPSRTQRTP